MEKDLIINLGAMSRTLGELSDGELKMLFFVYAYMYKTGKWMFVHNQEMRDYAASIGFSRSKMCYSNLLSSLAEKGYLLREAKGVYCVLNENLLFKPTL